MSEHGIQVLLDSNAYFRLGVSVHPLLTVSFGDDPQYSLCVLADLDNEYRNSTRLRTKFDWVGAQQYVQDRSGRRLELSKSLRTQADKAFQFLCNYSDEHRLNVSRVDLKALAAAFVYNIPVVTDDINMSKVADAHSIECWHTIKLLRVMVSTHRIDMEKVEEILEYLEYENDLPMHPAKLRVVFKEYFGTDCPI
jgi:hypothetical protein